jgi:hypothetical protein
MFCPPPPQSNIELLEQQHAMIYKKVVKSDDLFTIRLSELYSADLYSNTVESSDIYESKTINNFIKNNNLIDYLSQVEQHTKKYFPHSVIHKELYTDPEEEVQKLYLTILTSSMSRKEVLKNTRKLFVGWELATNKNFNTYINITARTI